MNLDHRRARNFGSRNVKDASMLVDVPLVVVFLLMTTMHRHPRRMPMINFNPTINLDKAYVSFANKPFPLQAHKQTKY